MKKVAIVVGILACLLISHPAVAAKTTKKGTSGQNTVQTGTSKAAKDTKATKKVHKDTEKAPKK